MDKEKFLQNFLKKHHVGEVSSKDVSFLLEEFQKIEQETRAENKALKIQQSIDAVSDQFIEDWRKHLVDEEDQKAIGNWSDPNPIDEYNNWFNGWSHDEEIKVQKEDLWAAEDAALNLAAKAFGFEIGDNFVYKANGRECLGTIVGWNFDTPIVWIQDDPEDVDKETDPELTQYLAAEYRTFSKYNYYTYFDRELISTMTEHDKEAFLIRTKTPFIEKSEQERNLEASNIAYGDSVFFVYEDSYLRGRVLKNINAYDKVAIEIEEVIFAPEKSRLQSGYTVEQFINKLTPQVEANKIWAQNNRLGLYVGDYTTVKACPYNSKYRLLGTYKDKSGQNYLHVSNEDNQLRSGILPECLTRLTPQQVRDFRGIKQLRGLGLEPDQRVKIYIGKGNFKDAFVVSYDADRKDVVVKNVRRSEKEKYHKIWDIYPRDIVDKATRAAEIKGFRVGDSVLISEKDKKSWKIVSFFHESGEDRAIIYDEQYDAIVSVPLHKISIAPKEIEKIRNPIAELNDKPLNNEVLQFDSSKEGWQRVNVKVDGAKIGETKIGWDPNFIVGSFAKETLVEKPMSTAHKVAYRVAASQASKLVKLALLKTLEQKADNQAISALHVLFDTEIGEAIVAELMGLALDRLPSNHKLKPLAKELQISGMALAGNSIFDSLLQELIPALNNIFAELPKEEESKRIKTSLVQSTDSVQNEEEQQDHAPGNTVPANRVIC